MTTSQTPIGSGFGAASTTADVMAGIRLTGKNVVVTGGYSGLGRETVRTLREAGAFVIVPARDVTRAKAQLQGIDAEVWPLDLIDHGSIKLFVQNFLKRRIPLHLLINSAGIMACPLQRDARGYESQFAVNHLGHFQLTLGLLPALQEAHGARVISVSSRGHRFAPMDFEDPHFNTKPYDRWVGYGQSKTANILFALELDRRMQKDSIRAFSVHPGSIVDTGLGKHLSQEDLRAVGAIDEKGHAILDPKLQLKTVSQGAATLVWCATSPQLEGLGGVYCENCDVAKIRTEADDALRIGVHSYAVDPESAKRLWTFSEELLQKGG